MRRARGFTLIEIMVTVAIVAILATIAYPSYTDYIRRGRITEATTGLQDSRVRMEQFFLDNRSYCVGGGAGCVAGAAGTGWNNNAGCGINAPIGQSFQFDCTATANTYTITANGLAARAMNGFVYTINQTNTRATVSAWSGLSNANCWILKKDGSC